MGSVKCRLRLLESLRRAQAVAEEAAIYEQLTDEEIALTITGMEAVRERAEPTAEEVAVGRRLDEMGDEEIIAAAIGLEEGMSEEEVSCRTAALARELGLWKGREQGISRHLTAIREGKRYVLEKTTRPPGEPEACRRRRGRRGGHPPRSVDAGDGRRS